MKNELGDTTEEIMPTLAQRWEERGEKRGIQEGMQKGMQKGVKKGVKKGIMQACRKALRCKIPVETVSSITGLSVKKVLEIKKELSKSGEYK